MGHKRSTRTRELVKAIGTLAKDRRLIPLRQRPAPHKAVLKVRWGDSNRSHFVVKVGKLIYDPAFPQAWDLHDWETWIQHRKGRVTSALELA